MENFAVAGGGTVVADPVESMSFYRGRRGLSCGSAASVNELRGSQNSARFGSRFSCLSSVRDEHQTMDEYRRKQRVVRYMEEEREQAERARIERDEHMDWVSFRLQERKERFRYLSVQEVSAILQREAEEAERERRAAEEAMRRSSQAAQQRRRTAANSGRSAIEGPRRKEPEEQRVTTQVSRKESTANLETLKFDFQQREEELLVKLRRAEYDTATARADAEDAGRRLTLAEKKQLQQSRRADEEAAARERAETRVKALEERLEELLSRISSMGEEMQRMKEDVERKTLMLANIEERLRTNQEELRAVQKDKKELEAKCEQLQLMNDALTEKLNNAKQHKASQTEVQQSASDLPTRENKSQERTTSTPRIQASKLDTNCCDKTRNSSHSLQTFTETQRGERKQYTNKTSVEERELNGDISPRKGSEKFVARPLQSHRSKNDSLMKECPERSEQEAMGYKAEAMRYKAEAMRYKAEAEASQRELSEARKIYDQEIASLKTWCGNLNARCNRQTSELRDQMLRGGARTPRTGRREEVVSGRGDPGSLGSSRAGDTLRTPVLHGKSNEVGMPLRDSWGREQHTVELADTLGKQRFTPLVAKTRDETVVQEEKLSGSGGGKQGEELTAKDDAPGAPLRGVNVGEARVIVPQTLETCELGGAAITAGDGGGVNDAQRVSEERVVFWEDVGRCARADAEKETDIFTATGGTLINRTNEKTKVGCSPCLRKRRHRVTFH